MCVVHNETSTGVVSDIGAVRRAIDAAGHPALLLVDTISSLGSIDYRHDAWGVDVTVAGSQKGLMLPPGLSFNAVSEKALAASKSSKMPKAFWNWEEMLAANANGWFPYTPATNLFYGLSEACDMLLEEGLDAVFARHARHAEATRGAVNAWGLEILCSDPKAYSRLADRDRHARGHDADAFRKVALENFNLSLGQGLGKVAGKVFRIGHLGDFNDLMLMGALSGVEMALGSRQGAAQDRRRAGRPHLPARYGARRPPLGRPRRRPSIRRTDFRDRAIPGGDRSGPAGWLSRKVVAMRPEPRAMVTSKPRALSRSTPAR